MHAEIGKAHRGTEKENIKLVNSFEDLEKLLAELPSRNSQ